MAKTILKSVTTVILLIVFTISVDFESFAQSPKKLFQNGFYEQAFINAAKKQNKKVKVKRKHTDIITKSYDRIYQKADDIISSSNYNWQQSYDQLIRVVRFRSKVKHPAVIEKLKNVLYDENFLGNLSVKYNKENKTGLDMASSFENNGKYIKALDIYHKIKVRQDQAKPISTFKDRLNPIDTEEKIEQTNRLIGDQYINQAQKLVFNGSIKEAEDAIKLIKTAKQYRPLDQEEERLLELANLIIRKSWIQEAKDLLKTKTKRNGRLAYELINKTRAIKNLTTEETLLLQQAKELGMTKIYVLTKGENNIYTSKQLSGVLNKEKKSDWVTYYSESNESKFDFNIEVTEHKPKVVLEKVRTRIEQKSKQVVYYENETNDSGKVEKVKKTKNVTAMVAIASRIKRSYIDWNVSLIDQLEKGVVYTEKNESIIERVNEFASIQSGDVLALPDNIESDISLDSQPFPEDQEMSNLATKLFVKELNILLRNKKNHLLNIDFIQE